MLIVNTIEIGRNVYITNKLNMAAPKNSHKIHDGAIKSKHFPCYSPFVRETTGHRWIPLTKASDAEL